MLKIVLTGGGTGGHIYPLVAVGESLKKLATEDNVSLDLYYLGVSGDYEFILESADIRVHNVAGGKMRSYSSWRNFFDIFLITYSFFQSIAALFFIMPDVIFSKGGPGTAPVILAGKFYRIPVIIHESDAVPGRSNLIAGRHAARIAISFPSAAKYFGDKNVALVGNPIRAGLLKYAADKNSAMSAFELNAALPVIVVLGGSQGAIRINDFIFDNLEKLLNGFQILHQVGARNYDESLREERFLIGNFTPEEKSRYKIFPYFKNERDMAIALSAADVVVARAGAGTIFEIAAFGKPSILIPLPEAAGDHQSANAYEYAGAGAATVIEQKNLLFGIFEGQLNRILKDKELAGNMSKAALAFARPQAADMIASEILKLAGRI